MASVCQFLFTKFKRTSVLNTLFKIVGKDSVSVKQLLKFWILNKIFILCNFEGPYNNHWIMEFSLEAVTSPWNEVHLINSEQGKYSEVLSWFIQFRFVRFVRIPTVKLEIRGKDSVCTKFKSEQLPSKPRQTMVTFRP